MGLPPLQQGEGRNRCLRMIPVGVVSTLLLSGSLLGLLSCSSAPGQVTPEQPLLFSHRIHAQQLRMECQYCHAYARRSASAGVPTVKRCMGCHEPIGPKTAELQKLQDHWDQREPIVWKKVYDVPDYVRFFHDRHVQADVACQTCHGPVETMERVSRVKELKMRDCVQCHRERHASVDCLVCHY